MPEQQSSGWQNLVQTALTRGLDYLSTKENARLRINDPTPQVAGANGVLVRAGDGAVALNLSAVPSWVWLAGGAVILAAVVVPLLRR